MPAALVREIASSFHNAIVSGSERSPDVELAREQHRRYIRALDDAGYHVEEIPADDAHPDCVFIEDPAVIVGKIAVITRPGALERRGEVGPVADRLGATFPLAHIEEPGTLDGGDVMILGETMFVGRSKRTNDAGITQLADIAAAQGLRTVTVPVHEVLHLKSGVRPVTMDTAVVTPGTVDEALLAGLHIIHEDPDERRRFSALPMANGDVLVTASAPNTAQAVTDLGVDVIPIDVSEIQAADGGLTCMSILIND
jgi:dimethylargininase